MIRGAVAFLVLPLLLVLPASAASPTSDDDPRLATILDLSSEQVSKLARLRRVRDGALQPLRRDVASRRAELRTLWRSANPDRKLIEAKLDQVDALNAKIRAAKLDFRFALHDLLTPSQRTRLAAHLQNRR